jgi:hypothetical protein
MYSNNLLSFANRNILPSEQHSGKSLINIINNTGFKIRALWDSTKYHGGRFLFYHFQKLQTFTAVLAMEV